MKHHEELVGIDGQLIPAAAVRRYGSVRRPYCASMSRLAVAATCFVFLALAGCGSAESDDQRSAATSSKAVATSAQPERTDKFTQTWTKPYNQTTCAEFKSDMSEQQRWTMAADMLVNAQQVDDSDADLPKDALISEFEAGLNTACVIDTMSMAEVGAGLYITEQDRFRP